MQRVRDPLQEGGAAGGGIDAIADLIGSDGNGGTNGDWVCVSAAAAAAATPTTVELLRLDGNDVKKSDYLDVW